MDFLEVNAESFFNYCRTNSRVSSFFMSRLGGSVIAD